jgi:hypothetical protein
MKPNDFQLLPAPLTAVDCDLRDFAFMPLDVVRLRDSDLAVVASAEEFRCAVLLWCAAWHQVPAASLPDDDKILAQYAGYGRVVKEWQKVRAGALRGWMKCSDGRLYHPVVADKASEAWAAKLRQRLKTECARIKKHNERHKTNIPFPEFEAWIEAGCPTGQPLFVPSDNQSSSHGQSGVVPNEKPSKGQGEGQGQGLLTPTTPDGVVVASQAGNLSTSRPDPAPRAECPHKEIIALYHEILPECPRVRDWTPARAQQLRARWNEDVRRQNLDYWRQYFEYVKRCGFLVGRGKGDRPFLADLEWLTKSKNFTSVREGKYE